MRRAAQGEPTEGIRLRMERMYRPQRHIYDLTRRCYLLGRDRLIAGLAMLPGESVLEVGCGTGRNLVRIGRRYPGARLYGLDAAAAMLETAAAKLRRAGLDAALVQGAAEELDANALFGCKRGFDHVVISYCLSMVDDPAAAIRAAVRSLAPGGVLHIVDFGDMKGLPGPFRRLMAAWLARFGVHHRPETAATVQALASARNRRLERTMIGRGYAVLFRLSPARPLTPRPPTG